jgi:hypothetical protein
MSIHVHIDRVVLEGVPLSGEQVNLFQNELQEALKTLLSASDRQQLRARGSVARLDAPVVDIAGKITPARLGSQVGAAVAAGIAGFQSAPSQPDSRRTP